jgi:CheY-like chemotaxis protein
MAQKRIGDLLVEAGVITPEQLQQVLARQASEGESRIASEILGLGLANERAIATAMARSTGSPTLVFSESTLDLAPVGLVPKAIAFQHAVLPVAMDEETVTVAAADVDSRPIFEQLGFATGRRVTAVMAVDQLLRAAIPNAYAIAEAGEKLLKGSNSPHDTPHLELARDVVEEEDQSAVDFVKSLSGFGERSGEYSVLNPDPQPQTPPAATPLEHLTGDHPLPSGKALGAVQLKQMEVLVLSTPAAEPHEHAQLPADKKSVYVIEDDQAIRTLIAKAMQHDGYHVLEAGTGDAGAELMRGGKPHLVILDAMLPGMHGFEICARIKGAAMFADVPVIMVSAVYRGWEQAREIQEVHGADVFLEKPFDVHYLRKIAAQQLGEHLERVELPPDRAGQVLSIRGAVGQLAAQGRWQEALEQVSMWLALDPFDPLAHLEAGNLRSQLRDLEGAMRCYEAAVVYDRNLFQALTNLALVYERLGFRRKAADSWRQAIANAPEENTRLSIEERLIELQNG